MTVSWLPTDVSTCCFFVKDIIQAGFLVGIVTFVFTLMRLMWLAASPAGWAKCKNYNRWTWQGNLEFYFSFLLILMYLLHLIGIVFLIRMRLTGKGKACLFIYSSLLVSLVGAVQAVAGSLVWSLMGGRCVLDRKNKPPATPVSMALTVLLVILHTAILIYFSVIANSFEKALAESPPPPLRVCGRSLTFADED